MSDPAHQTAATTGLETASCAPALTPQEVADALSAAADMDGHPARQLLETGVPREPTMGGHWLDRLTSFSASVWWSSEQTRTSPGELQRIVHEVFEAACGNAWGGVLLAGYLRAICTDAWERTWEHGQIDTLIRFAEEAWASTWPLAAGEGVSGATDIAVRYLSLLRRELLVETAAATGILTLHQRLAQATAVEAGGIRDDALNLPASPVSDVLAELAGLEARYYGALGHACAAADAYLTRSGDDLDAAIAHLSSVECSDDCDEEDGSELRAHRYALQAIREAGARDWFRVDNGTIVCTYPFGLYGEPSESVVDAARKHGEHWRLAGLGVTEPPTPFLMVDDIWHGDDALDRRYDGTQLYLPELTLSVPGGDACVPMKAEIRLSTLGNHQFRVEIPVQGVLPDHLFRLLWIPAPEYGNLLEIGGGIGTKDDGPVWGRLADVAAAVIADIPTMLERCAGLSAGCSSRRGMYHVIARVWKASSLPAGDPDRALDLEHPDRIPDLFGGQVVCHPIPSGIGSVAQWALYDADQPAPLPSPLLHRDLILNNVNMTLLACFGSPSFIIGYTQEALEFAFSMEGMFAAWQDQLALHHAAVRARIRQLGDQLDRRDGQVSIWRGDESFAVDIEQLERDQIRLRDFVTASEVSMMFIASPALVTSPLTRSLLDDFLEVAGVWKRHELFMRIADDVLGSRLEELIESRVRRHEERHQERVRRITEGLGFFIAAIGISGILSMIQAGWDIDGHNSTILVSIVVLLALAFTVVYRLVLSPPGRD